MAHDSVQHWHRHRHRPVAQYIYASKSYKLLLDTQQANTLQLSMLHILVQHLQPPSHQLAIGHQADIV